MFSIDTVDQSKGFEQLPLEVVRQYVGIPDHVTSYDDLGHIWLVPAAGTHGNEKLHVDYILKEQQDLELFYRGVLPIISNKLATEMNVRHIGDGNGRVAHAIRSLTGAVNEDYVLVDLHDNPAGYNFAGTGDVFPLVALEIGKQLGFSEHRFTREWSSMREYLHNYVLIEASLPDDPEEYIRDLEERMNRIVDLGISGLHRAYNNRIPKDLAYEAVGEILTVEPVTKEPNVEVLSILHELEAIEPHPNTPLSLTDRHREVLGLDAVSDYMEDGWGYGNNSEIIPNEMLGMPDDGRVRQLAFGALVKVCYSKPRFSPNPNRLQLAYMPKNTSPGYGEGEHYGM